MNMYFITSTVTKWIPLLSRDEFREIVLASLRFLIERKKILLHGYVLMPNHLHAILTALDPYTISDFFRDFHKFTAQQILKVLRNEKSSLQKRFESERSDRKYSIWQPSHMPKEVESEEFLLQKLEYIHNNPLQEKWNLAEAPEDYPYSSAKDYILEQPGILPLQKIEF